MARVNPIVNDFSAGELSQQLWFRHNLEIYPRGCRDLKNMVARVNGPAKKREGTYFVAAAKVAAHNCILIPFEYSSEQAYIIEAGNAYFRFYKDGGQIQDSGSPYEIATPYLHTELSGLKWVQIADTMYLVHPDHPPYKLIRSGHTDWSLEAVDFAWGPFLDRNTGEVTITPSAATGAGITLTASDDVFYPEHVGSVWKIGGDMVDENAFNANEWLGDWIEVDAGETLVFHLTGSWTATMRLYRSFDGGTNSAIYAEFTSNTSFELTSIVDGASYRWRMVSRSSGTCYARIVKPDQAGYCKITDVATSPSDTATADVIEDFPAIDATTKWSEGAWSNRRGWPRAIALHEQRLVLAGTESRPQTVWGSKVGDFEDFDTGDAGDEYGWGHILASQKVNDIQWLHSSTLLHIGTTGGLWHMGSTEPDTPITATAPNAKKDSGDGSASVQAFDVGTTPIYLRKAGSNNDRGWELLAIGYELNSDSWVSRSISERAEHLLSAGIMGMAFQEQPIPILWMWRADGALVSCTINLPAGVIAFSDHPQREGDAVESVAMIPGPDRDELWLVTRRSVNGSDVRYIEQMTTHNWSEIADAVYLDCAITYSGAATTVITGLGHLEGETVGVLNEGAAHPDRVVSGGEIELQSEATKAQIGLRYAARLRPMRIEAGTRAGTSQGRLRRTNKLTVGLIKTLGLKLGSDLEQLDDEPFRSGDDPMDSAPPLFTGEKSDISFPGGWEREGSIYLVNDLPMPFEVASIGPTMNASDF